MINVKGLRLQYVTDASGTRVSVLLPVDQFEELMEDIEDLAAVAARREEPLMSHKDVIEELRRDGLQVLQDV